VGRAIVALLAAVLVNVSLTALRIDHDAPVVALLAVTVVAAGVLALESMEGSTHVSWTAPRPDSRADPGEDTSTATYRHVIEAHETSREADDAVLWQLADLAARRMLQLHGFRYAEDPERATELLGPHLADLVSRDRRHRPGQRHRRYSVAQLGELVRRIEQL
jgi:hypothetical protein